MRLLAALITRPEAQATGIGAEQVTFAAMGVGAAAWAISFMRGRLKDDAVERAELRKLPAIVADLQVKVAQCETHREHDTENMRRLSADLAEIKKQHTADRNEKP